MSYSDFVCAVFLALQAQSGQHAMLSRATMDSICTAYDNGQTVAQCVRAVAPVAPASSLN